MGSGIIRSSELFKLFYDGPLACHWVVTYDHILQARKLTRSLDATMAMTGHKDLKLADHYSEIGQEVQRETSLKIESHLKQILSKSAVPGCTE